MIELTTDAMAHRGEAVGRVDGKAHFVAGALPGERVRGEVTHDGGSWARVRLLDVLDAAPSRVAPPCPHFTQCGGCQWQQADVGAQLAWKRETVAGQLAHLGRIVDADVRPTVSPGPPYGYRNRMDFRVLDGRPALHRSRSKDLVALDECHLLHPGLRDLFESLGDLSGASALTLRVSEATGQRLALVTGKVPGDADTWGCAVAQRSNRGLRKVIGALAIREEVAGARLRITGGAFFQNNTAGAAALASLVEEALEPTASDRMVDGYAGGGLFAATAGRSVREVVAIETSTTAVEDLTHNLETNGIHGEVIAGRFETELASVAGQVDLLVVDPPRVGLRSEGVDAVLDTMPRTLAYVSCDPASFARDAAALVAGGYTLEWVAPVDLFPQTWHIESVARFTRVGGG